MKIERYALKLDLRERGENFSGEETIYLADYADKLILDAADMVIRDVRINDNPVEFTHENDKLTVLTEPNGPVDLYISFEGKYSEALRGLYLVKRPEGSMVTTQFEATGARYAFPCFDDPSQKAEFELTLLIPAGEEAISNMPVKGESITDGTKRVEFYRTPRMSTYLLYIGAGVFDHISIKHRDKDLILAAPKGLLNSTDEPLKAASKILDYYERYFNKDYVLQKMHLIAVPEFAAGAMENWGAITFRESALLLNEKTSVSNRISTYMVIAHEIAHQWFGNLVTMKWWDDLWLNESFANFMGYKSVDSIYEDYDMWALYLGGEMSGGLRGDSLKSTHPIHVSVKDPESIEQIFDEISYNKGGSILRMIESFMGEGNFREGIREYLSSHAYGNATSQDLWRALDNHSDFRITDVMASWIEQSGYPVITVTERDGKLHLTQKPFKLLGDFQDQTWKVPVTVLRENGTESFLLEDREGDIEINGFIKLNRDETGFYRCYYDDHLMENISRSVDKLSHYDIWGILDDNLNFLISGLIKSDGYIRRLKFFMGSRDDFVIRTIAQQLHLLYTFGKEQKAFVSMGANYLKNILKDLGPKRENEPASRTIARSTVMEALILFDREYANELAKKAEDYENADPDMRQAILNAHALSRDDPEFLMDLLRRVKMDEDRERITASLGLLSGEEKLDRAVSAFGEGLIKAQDLPWLFIPMSTHDAGRDYILNHFGEIFENVRKIFAGSAVVSLFVERTVPSISLRDRERSLRILDELSGADVKAGVAKAREYVEILGNLKQRFRLE